MPLNTNPSVRLMFSQQRELCYYCNQKMIMIRPKGLPRAKWIPHIHPDRATREHIYPIGDIRRYIQNPYVLAHKKCNEAANTKFTKWYNEGYKYKEHKNLLINLLKL